VPVPPSHIPAARACKADAATAWREEVSVAQCAGSDSRSRRPYGVFKNQGDCVNFVATKGKNPPAGH
jgi:hypothetical protein